MDSRAHWDRVYDARDDRNVSWFEAAPEMSLTMLERAGMTAASCVIDVGGGNSRLVDALLDRGITCITVVDVSESALSRTRQRLAARASVPVWIAADVTGEWTAGPADLWHDRAVFHFLTEAADRQRYVEHLHAVLKPQGTAVVATFAPDGPEWCSGLPIVRYSPESLAAELGDRFRLVESARHVHMTPWGATQPFQYSRLMRNI